MPRYIALPSQPKASDWTEPAPIVRSYEVESTDKVPTGLVNQHGMTIYRESNPVGFTAKITD